MYTSHFGLEKLPFENVPDPVFFFDEGDYARIHNRIIESLKAGRGLMVVTGPIGSGKTTLSQIVKTEFSSDIQQIWMAEPPGSSTDLFMFVAQELGLKPSSSERTFVLRDIREALLNIISQGSKCLMIIDESHLMTDDVLSGIRMLNNLEEGPSKLIQILLLGQEEFMKTINRPEMEPFKQRIATLEMLGKMSTDGIGKYVSHRIHVAGGQASIFSDTGWKALFKAFESGSTPRVINSLCDRSLYVAFDRGNTAVDADDVYEAARGTGLEKEIFFFVVELRKKEKQQHAPSGREADSIGQPESLEGSPEHSVKEESGDIRSGNVVRQKENLQPTWKNYQTTYALSETDQEADGKKLRMPVLLLLLSLTALILSILFYCQKSGSPDLMTCLQELISF
jgi:general secretion pathway protein A